LGLLPELEDVSERLEASVVESASRLSTESLDKALGLLGGGHRKLGNFSVVTGNNGSHSGQKSHSKWQVVRHAFRGADSCSSTRRGSYSETPSPFKINELLQHQNDFSFQSSVMDDAQKGSKNNNRALEAEQVENDVGKQWSLRVKSDLHPSWRSVVSDLDVVDATQQEQVIKTVCGKPGTPSSKARGDFWTSRRNDSLRSARIIPSLLRQSLDEASRYHARCMEDAFASDTQSQIFANDEVIVRLQQQRRKSILERMNNHGLGRASVSSRSISACSFNSRRDLLSPVLSRSGSVRK